MKKLKSIWIILLSLALANFSWATPLMPGKLQGINSDAEPHGTYDDAFEDGMGISDVTRTHIISSDFRLNGFAFRFPFFKEPLGFYDLGGMTGENPYGGDPDTPDNGKESSAKPLSFNATFQKVGDNEEMGDVAVPGANPLPESDSMLLLGIGLISLATIRGKFKF